uniref:Cytochrome c oxidase subunit 5Ba n=1 Tax=Eptatretus burgeri TaxID=7764 RepID=A0A8C4QIG0_EPTBU
MEAAKLGLDPYSIQPPKNYPGTKEEPTLVPSVENKRLVACLCEEDSTGIAYFWLHEGDSQRCHNCGSYYKLVPQEMP